MRRTIAVALVSIACFGCATANVTSVRRAGTEGVRLDRIMVWADFHDLALRTVMERRMAEVQPLAFVPATSILFPGQSYTPEEQLAEIRRSGVNAVLFIGAVDAGSQTGYLPGTARSFNGTIVTTPPAAITSHSAQFQAVLQSVSDGQAIWTATADAKGAWGGTAEAARELVITAAESFAVRMIQEGLVPALRR